jgi:hypothetical protein
MSSCWSGDVDTESVVYPEDPYWTEAISSPSSCLLFLAWDGPAQRTAWLRNFMAHDFTWTGHIAYTLGLICCNVESTTFKIEKLYKWYPKADWPAGIDSDDDSDRDMGF